MTIKVQLKPFCKTVNLNLPQFQTNIVQKYNKQSGLWFGNQFDQCAVRSCVLRTMSFERRQLVEMGRWIVVNWSNYSGQCLAWENVYIVHSGDHNQHHRQWQLEFEA